MTNTKSQMQEVQAMLKQNKYQHFCTWAYHIKLKKIEDKDKILKVGGQEGMRLPIGVRITLNISVKHTSER